MNDHGKAPPPLVVSSPPAMPPDVAVRPQRMDAGEEGASGSHGTFRLHPWSGGLLLFLDNLLFGVNAVSLGLATPVVCFLAFTTTFIGVYLTQRHLDGNGRGASMAKAFLCAVLAGVPTPIAGTAFGTVILLTSGLSPRSRK